MVLLFIVTIYLLKISIKYLNYTFCYILQKPENVKSVLHLLTCGNKKIKTGAMPNTLKPHSVPLNFKCYILIRL